jgi:alkylhydroperoxidase family enzyme
MKIMGRDPELARLVMEVIRYVMLRPPEASTVDPGLRWLAGHVASQAAGCRYCMAHSAHFGVHFGGLPTAKVEAVWEFESSPLFSEAERVALRFALAAGSVPNGVTPHHFDELHRYWNDDQIVELAAAICVFGWFNRWNDTFATPLEQDPLEFARLHLVAAGWDPGRHVSTPAPAGPADLTVDP